MSLVFDLVREGNRLVDDGADASALAGAVAEIVDVLGIYDAEPAPHRESELSDIEVAELVEARNLAREERRYAEADQIRDRLAAAGVTIEDGPDGTRWLRR
jgi:cysteinyl-tRNA synthetase